MFRQEKKALRDRCSDLGGRLITLSQAIERATGLSSKFTATLNYLYKEFRQIHSMLEVVKGEQELGLKKIKA